MENKFCFQFVFTQTTVICPETNKLYKFIQIQPYYTPWNLSIIISTWCIYLFDVLNRIAEPTVLQLRNCSYEILRPFFEKSDQNYCIVLVEVDRAIL